MNKEVDNLQKLGYLNIDIDPVLNLFEEIEKLKIEKMVLTLCVFNIVCRIEMKT